MSKRYLFSCTVQIKEPKGATTEVQRITPDGLNIDNFRISSSLDFGNKYVVFYDWQPSIFHTWEERSGLAITRKFKEFKQIENFESSRGTESLRYIEAVRSKDEIFLYYEISTQEGGHELMMNKLRAEELKKYMR